MVLHETIMFPLVFSKVLFVWAKCTNKQGHGQYVAITALHLSDTPVLNLTVILSTFPLDGDEEKMHFVVV